ncbi:AraC-like DNA-binding protein [Bradyrhizobium sp. AZCC 1678]
MPTRSVAVPNGKTCMTEATDFATIRFSTDDLPEEDRVSMWREHYGCTVLGVEIEPAEDALFQSSIVSRHLPGLNLVSGNMSAARVKRTRKFVADGNDDVALLVNCTGAAAIAAGEREVVLRERDAVLIRSDQVITFDRFVSGRSSLLRVPRSIISQLVSDIDEVSMRHITRKTDALRLLTGYAATLLDDNAVAATALLHLAVSHIHDLVALALGATRDHAGAAQDRGVRAARLIAAKTYIMQQSGRRDLSVGAVAAELGVSARYLQMLFEVDGTTFSAFLLNRRLVHAHRMLCAPRSRRRPVSTIAYDVGFGDLSYFNRSFRNFYGLTPRDVREAAANEPDNP